MPSAYHHPEMAWQLAQLFVINHTHIRMQKIVRMIYKTWMSGIILSQCTMHFHQTLTKRVLFSISEIIPPMLRTRNFLCPTKHFPGTLAHDVSYCLACLLDWIAERRTQAMCPLPNELGSQTGEGAAHCISARVVWCRYVWMVICWKLWGYSAELNMCR